MRFAEQDGGESDRKMSITLLARRPKRVLFLENYGTRALTEELRKFLQMNKAIFFFLPAISTDLLQSTNIHSSEDRRGVDSLLK